jgi:hypothetical protein
MVKSSTKKEIPWKPSEEELALRKVESRKAAQVFRHNREQPVPLNTIPKEERNGWLSPAGTFYHVNYLQHIVIAYDLDDCGESGLEKKGWIKMVNGGFIEPLRERTQAQLDKIFDWYRHIPGCILPRWLEK